MSELQIGLSGLQVAQKALEIIGTNIANASTEGYHRQEMHLASLPIKLLGDIATGGVEVAHVRRAIDVLLEKQLLVQAPQLGETSQQVLTLRSVEGALGDVGSEGLMNAVDKFFLALRELAPQPDSQPLREQVVWSADALAKHFASLGRFLQDLEDQLPLQAQDLIAEVNNLALEIADLNRDIGTMAIRGGNPNLLLDRRDQAIMEMGELVSVQTHASTTPGAVNVSVWGTPVVVGGQATLLEVGTVDDGDMGLSVKDASFYQTDVSGGRVGALMELKNSILKDLRARLDSLASEIAYNVNLHHVQGVGPDGAFTELKGWPASDQPMSAWSEWGGHLQAGTLYVCIHDGTTGTTAHESIDVLGADTVATLAGKFDALAGLTGSVLDGGLRIGVEDTARYSFDFRPTPITTLQGGWSGSSQPDVSGIYTGAANETFTCTVQNGGSVGVTQGLTVRVENAAAELVTTLNVGLGYAAGDRLELTDGLYVSFDAGDLTDTETFTIDALARSDTSGFLATAGLNTFFKGDSLTTLAVDDEVMANSRRLSVALAADMADNTNVRRMADVGDEPVAVLGNVSPVDFFLMIVTGVGQRIHFAQARYDSLEAVRKQLMSQRDDIGGVDINDEAAKMLVFERMFQAAAKWISAQDQAMQTLIELL